MRNVDIAYGQSADGNGFSGDYNDLTNKPVIPATTTDLPDSEDKRYVTDEQKADIHDPEAQNSAIASKTTLAEVKADTDIADALSKKHSNSLDHASGSDNQDLSGLVVKETGKSLVADTEIAKIHADTLDHSNTNDPTADQKAALAGTSGTPSGTNKYVTNDDSRLAAGGGSSTIIWLGDI